MSSDLGSAPDFRSRNQYGESLSLADLAGRPALLFFYPWAFSGICSGSCRSFRAAATDFEAAGVRVLAISCDAMFTLRAFADDAGLPFDLLTDHWPHGEIARAYGVFDDGAGCSLRGSFLLDAAGAIFWSDVRGIGEARDIDAHRSAAQRLAG